MLRTKKIPLLSILLLIVVATGAAWFTPLHSSLASLGSPHPGLPYAQQANGPYTVQGNTILDANGQPYLFHGIGRDGLEFLCQGDGYFDAQHLAYMGPGTNTSTSTYWYANTVRLSLSQAIWFKGQSSHNCTAAQYQAFVKQTVDTLTSMHLNVVINLHWSDADGQAAGGAGWEMPDNLSVTFWQQAAAIYGRYSNVLFELYNEPHAGWNCLLFGCQIANDREYVPECQCTQTFSYQGVSIQTLVNAVRATGAKNLIAAPGDIWSFDLSQYQAHPLSGSNIIYDTHPYDYSNKQPNSWDASFGNLSAVAPVISLEFGEYDCNTHYIGQLIPYFDAHKIGWTAWAWISVGSACGYPQLVTDYNGTPAVSMGTYLYNYLRSYISVSPTPTPTSTPGPSTVGRDTFHRANQSLWGVASDGQTWSGDANTATVFSISKNVGLVSNTGSVSYSAVLGQQATNAEVYASASVSSFTNGNFGAVLRWTDGNNWYKAYIDGTSLVIQMRIAGAVTTLASVPFAATAGAVYRIHFRVVRSTLEANAWSAAGKEPTTWMVTATNSTLASGYCGLRFFIQTGTIAVTSFVAKAP